MTPPPPTPGFQPGAFQAGAFQGAEPVMAIVIRAKPRPLIARATKRRLIFRARNAP
jgi:hypothetical protein